MPKLAAPLAAAPALEEAPAGGVAAVDVGAALAAGTAVAVEAVAVEAAPVAVALGVSTGDAALGKAPALPTGALGFAGSAATAAAAEQAVVLTCSSKRASKAPRNRFAGKYASALALS